MIEISGLIKKYGDLTAVNDVSFAAGPGSIFGLLGPNGAGKSTTIGCISGLLKPTGGSIRVNGHDVVSQGIDARKALGVVPQEIALYDEISAVENLTYWAGIHGLRGSDLKQRIGKVLELTGLADRAKEPIKRYSGGMKRRLNFAVGIIHSPKVLLLDEPTVGVDPQSRVRLLDLVRDQAKQEGTCVIYTTHYMEEAEALCDHLGIVDHGKMIAQGTLRELRGMTAERDVLRLVGRFPATARTAVIALPDLELLKGESESALTDETLLLSAAGASKRLPEIFAAITSAGGEVRETTLTQPSLESLFIKLTGKELRDA